MIIDLSKKNKKYRIIVGRKKFFRNFINRGIGLMFHKKIKDTGYILVFNKEKKIPLHMFFVFFPLDALFLDKDKKIIEIKKNLKPFAIYNPKNKAKYVIELAKGVVNKKKVMVGDRLIF